jgi:hypothetical protein
MSRRRSIELVAVEAAVLDGLEEVGRGDGVGPVGIWVEPF